MISCCKHNKEKNVYENLIKKFLNYLVNFQKMIV